MRPQQRILADREPWANRNIITALGAQIHILADREPWANRNLKTAKAFNAVLQENDADEVTRAFGRGLGFP